MSRVLAWVRRNSLLLLGWAVLIGAYGLLAMQGALPLLSPDETAVFTLAQSIGESGRAGVFDARAQARLWLHPRSFLVQDGWLLPVGFPLWPVLLALVGWVGSGTSILWAQVTLSASAVIPLTLLAERLFGWRRGYALLWSMVVFTSPLAILYGARSGFTLMPQLALFAWVGWGYACGPRSRWSSVGLGALAIIALGLRPTEVVWMVPILLAAAYHFRAVWRASYRWLLLGLLLGALGVLGVHWWVYGAPWLVGYLLPSSSSMVQAVPAASGEQAPLWQRWLPYGVSPAQLRANAVEALRLGWWVWATGAVLAAGVWLVRWRSQKPRVQAVCLTLLVWTTAWLLFYYGQGRFADHIGGQSMHLGSSFLRYLAPVVFGWIGWTAWVLIDWGGFARRRLFVLIPLLVSSMIGGMVWAYTDAEDGLLRGRREREMYATVRQAVQAFAPADAIWISDRSDKMLFPSRMSVSPVPPREDLLAFLRTQRGQVFLFARPPRQEDRDTWTRAGLELIERRSFSRETVYEVRIRPGFAEKGADRAH